MHLRSLPPSVSEVARTPAFLSSLLLVATNSVQDKSVQIASQVGWARVLSELRALAREHGWGRAELGTHVSRRGAARAILSAGGSFAQLLKAGQRRSAAYQLYLDLGRQESQAAADILFEASDVED